jgi:hypothetical protein
MTKKLLDTYQKQIVPIIKKNGIRKASFFGSFVTGKAKDESDIDILIEPPENMSLLDFIGVKQDIEDRVKRTVDLVSYRGISPYLKDNILSQQLVFYEA